MFVEKYKNLGYRATYQGKMFAGFTRVEAMQKAINYAFKLVQRNAKAVGEYRIISDAIGVRAFPQPIAVIHGGAVA